jgi:hypothetical protein
MRASRFKLLSLNSLSVFRILGIGILLHRWEMRRGGKEMGVP